MQPKVRSLPITIIDFLAIFLPGFVWLLLFIATFHLIYQNDISPNVIYATLHSHLNYFGIWTVALLILIFSLLIGNILKPMTMEAAEKIVSLCPDNFLRKLFKWYMDIETLDRKNKEINEKNIEIDKWNENVEKKGKGKKKEREKNIELSKLKFPFDDLHAHADYFTKVKEQLEKKIDCEPDKLAGHKLFSAAKRYIRFISPTLWEESERMEAEVRMTGALFLASIYSILLIIAAFGFEIIKYFMIKFTNLPCAHFCINLSDKPSILFWLGMSIIAALILVVGWTHLRHNEVSYTYINTLIALGNKIEKDSKILDEE
jgi:hypothetical protein